MLVLTILPGVSALINYTLPTETNASNKSQNWIYVNVTVNETNETNITFITFNLYNTSLINNTTYSLPYYFADLISYYKFDEAYGTTASDSKGYMNGIATANTLIGSSGIIINSSTFDGSSKKINIGNGTNLISGAQVGSVSMWYKANTLDNDHCLLCKGDTGDNSPYTIFLIQGGTGKLSFQGSPGIGSKVTTNQVISSTGTWYHIVVTSNGTNILFYVNGTLMPSTLTTGPADGFWYGDSNGNTIDFGVLDRPSKFGWADGYMDEVAIFDRALNSTEVMALYNNGTGVSYTSDSQIRSQNFTGLPDGTYYYNVTATDLANQQNTTETRQITLDTRNPSINQTLPTNATYTNNSSVNFTWAVSDLLTGSGIQNTTLYVYNASNGTLVNQTTTYSYELSDIFNAIIGIPTTLLDSTYNWFVNTFDFANNYNETVNRTLTVDTINPSINITFPLNGQNYSTSISSLNYTYSDANPGYCWYNKLDISLNQNISLYYKLDESSGAVIDSSGNRNGSNYNSQTGISGIQNYAYNFTNGGTTFINTTQNFSWYSNESFSFSLWIKPTSLADWQVVFGKYNFSGVDGPPPTYMEYSLYFNSDHGNRLEFVYWIISGDYIRVYSSSAPPIGNWTHVVITSNGSVAKMYLNGVLVSTDSAIGGTFVHDTSMPLFIGGGYAPLPAFNTFNGAIDEFAIWNKSLNQTDVDSLYNSGIGLTYPPEIISSSVAAGTNFTATPVMGENIWTLYCNDSVGNLNSTSTTFVYDNTAPNVTLVSPTNDTYANITQNNFTANISEDVGLINATFYLYNSTGGLYNNTTTILSGTTQATLGNVLTLTDGIYYWYYDAYNLVGTITSADNFTLTINTIYPQINYTAPTEVNASNKSQDWIYINVSITETNFANITFSLYNGTSIVLLNNTTYTNATTDINFTNLQDSVYYYNVTIIDLANQQNTTETRQITLDTGNASIIQILPTNATYTNNTTINFTWAVNDSSPGEMNGSGIQNTTLYVYNASNGTLVNQTTTYSYELSDIFNAIIGIPMTLLDGVYNWFVDVFDFADNYNATTNRTLTVDTVGPQINFSTGIAGNTSNLSRDWIYANVSINELTNYNLTFILYNSTNGSVHNQTIYSSINNTSAYINWTSLPNGHYSYEVNITDLTNYSNSSGILNITLDTVTPRISKSYPPNASGIAYINTSSIIFNFTVNDSTSGVYNLTLSLYNNSSGALLNNTTLTYSDLDLSQNILSIPMTIEDGIYNWDIASYDFANNYVDPNDTFLIDTIYPLINFTTPTEENATNFSRDWIYINVTVNETNEANITFTLHNSSGQFDEITFIDGTLAWNFTLLSDGDYYYNVTVTDLANNQNSTETRQITLDTGNASIIQILPTNATYTNNTTINFTWAVNDSSPGEMNGSGIQNTTLYVYNASNGTLVNQTTTYSYELSDIFNAIIGIPMTLLDGAYNWFVDVFDFADNYNTTTNRTLTVDTVGPQINFSTGILTNTSNVSTTWIYANVSVNELTNYNLTFTLYNSTNGSVHNQTIYTSINNTSAYINWTSLPNGHYSYEVNITDLTNYSNSSGLMNITLDTFSPSINKTYPSNNTDTYALFNQSVCYQETANVSTACGGLNTGTYNISHESTHGVLFINYTKPIGADSALWQVKHSNLSTYNVTIPDSCFNYQTDKVSLEFFTFRSIAQSRSYGMCLNASGWNIITNLEEQIPSIACSGSATSGNPLDMIDGDWDTYIYNSMGSSWLVCDPYINAGNTKPRIYEEAIIWLNQTNISLAYVNTSNVTFNFTVNDSTSGIYNLTFFLYNNTSGTLINNTTWIYSDISLNNNIIIFPLILEDGRYQWDIAAYDFANNFVDPNDSFIVDTIYPLINFTTPTEANTTNVSRNWIYVNVTVNETNEANITFDLYNIGSSLISSPYSIVTVSLVTGGNDGLPSTIIYMNDSNQTTFGNATVTNVGTVNAYADLRNISFDLNDGDLQGDTRIYMNISTFLGAVYIPTWHACYNWSSSSLVSFSGFSHMVTPGNYLQTAIVPPDCIQNTTHRIDFRVEWLGGNPSEARIYEIWVNYNLTHWSEFYTDNRTYHNFTGIPNGVYYYNVTVTDLANNQNNTETREITLDTVSPQLNQTYPLNNTYTTNSNITFNWTVNDTSGIKNTTIYVYKNDYTDCYQETANVATSCGGLNSGNYSDLTGNWLSIANAYDGNWGTLARCNAGVGGSCGFLIGYTIPQNATGAIWQLRDGSPWNGYRYTNVTVPTSCFIPLNGRIQFYIVTPISANSLYAYCSGNNGSNYTLIINNFNLGYDIVEEAIYWNVSGINYSLVNQTTKQSHELSNIFNELVSIPISLTNGIYKWFVDAWDFTSNYNYTSNYTLTIDTADPQYIYFITPTKNNNTYENANWIYANTIYDTFNLANITFKLYNYTTGALINNTTYSSFGGTNNSINWTGLIDGKYLYNVTATKFIGGNNSTETRLITLDTTNPLINYSSGILSNNSNTTNNWIYINVTVTELNQKSINFTLYNGYFLWGDLVYPPGLWTYYNNTSLIDYGLGYYSYNFTGLPDAEFWYNVTITDQVNRTNTTPIMNITLDATLPSINITSPIGIDYAYINGSIDLNFTAIDDHLSNCWYYYNGTNTSISCTSGIPAHTSLNLNGTIVNMTSNTLIFYANDTYGNLANQTVNYSYKILENWRSYNTTTFETAWETYTINANQTGNASVTATFVYGGTVYTTVKNGTNYGAANFTAAFAVPVGVTNKTFYWNFTYSNGSVDYIMTNTSNQSVNLTLLMMPCNATSNKTYANITFYDEVTSSPLTATINQMTWVYWLGDSRTNKTFLFSNSTWYSSNYTFCLIPNNRTLYTALNIYYEHVSTGGSDPNYYQRVYSNSSITLTNNSLYTLNLPLLSSTEGHWVQIVVGDSSGLAINGVDILVTRVISGVETVIGHTSTDVSGSASFFLSPSYPHTFYLSKNDCSNLTSAITPTQSSYTLTMMCEANVPTSPANLSLEGIRYWRAPLPGVLTSTGNTTFAYYVDSELNNIDRAYFQIFYSSNGTIVIYNQSDADTIYCNNSICFLTGVYDVKVGDDIKGAYYVDVGTGYVLLDGDARWKQLGVYTDAPHVSNFFKHLNEVTSNWNDVNNCRDYTTQRICEGKGCTWDSNTSTCSIFKICSDYNIGTNVTERRINCLANGCYYELATDNCYNNVLKNRQEFSRFVLIFLVLAIILAVFGRITGYDAQNPGIFLIILSAVILLGSASNGITGPGYFYYSDLTRWEFVNNWILFVTTLFSSIGYWASTIRRQT